MRTLSTDCHHHLSFYPRSLPLSSRHLTSLHPPVFAPTPLALSFVFSSFFSSNPPLMYSLRLSNFISLSSLPGWHFPPSTFHPPTNLPQFILSRVAVRLPLLSPVPQFTLAHFSVGLDPTFTFCFLSTFLLLLQNVTSIYIFLSCSCTNIDVLTLS